MTELNWKEKRKLSLALSLRDMVHIKMALEATAESGETSSEDRRQLRSLSARLVNRWQKSGRVGK